MRYLIEQMPSRCGLTKIPEELREFWQPLANQPRSYYVYTTIIERRLSSVMKSELRKSGAKEWDWWRTRGPKEPQEQGIMADAVHLA